MHIANPIYDVVFKYMLEDNKVAKLFLSAIIGENITELGFSAHEHIVEIQPPPQEKERMPLTVCRLDFSAKIETETGFKTVIIELQKAKYLSDLMRFRRYMGLHYQNPDNSYDNDPEKARQIYCIYFLDYGMDLPKRPVLKVDYKVQDAYTGDEFPATGEFVAGLHHRSWIVQIRQLKKRRRNDLEKILSIFDQSNLMNKYILDVDEDNYPEEYQQIIRRLRKAMEDPKQRRAMELEEDVIKELQDKERKIEAKSKLLMEKELMIAEKEQTIADKEQTIADKEQTIADKEQTIADKEQTIADKEQTIADKEQTIADKEQTIADKEQTIA
ncbi:MAG: hypothetical protein FWD09_01380, partial [Lentimicrobiaceae bacterium]|nr:hypothetical protein [Lentimicrobiaceae bacterium]